MRGGKRSICGEPLGAQCERFELPADRCRLSTVSYSGWLIPRGGAIAPVSKLHVLFEGVTYADGAVETEDDVDGAHLFVAEVSVTEVADAATLDLPEHTTTAIEFSGRKVVHFDIALVDRLAPELVPWAWAVNTAASVLGAILALVVAIHFGFTTTALVGGGVYVALCIPAYSRLAAAAAA